jgi:hypothetical protein
MQAIDDDHAARGRLGRLSVGLRSVYTTVRAPRGKVGTVAYGFERTQRGRETRLDARRAAYPPPGAALDM